MGAEESKCQTGGGSKGGTRPAHCKGKQQTKHRNMNFNERKRVPLGTANINVCIIKGDLTIEKSDVIVCTASKNLDLSRGRASKALLEKAGPKMKDDCEQQYPDGIEYDEIAVVNAGNLPCKKVYFVALPVWGTGHDEQKGLETLLKKCIKCASDNNCESIAFPALGTGLLKYPADKVAHWTLQYIEDFSNSTPNTSLKYVNIIVFYQDNASFNAFEQEARSRSSKSSQGGASGGVKAKNAIGMRSIVSRQMFSKVSNGGGDSCNQCMLKMSIRSVLPFISRHRFTTFILQNQRVYSHIATTSKHLRSPTWQSKIQPARFVSTDQPSSNSGSDHHQQQPTFHLDVTDSDIHNRVLEGALDYVGQYGWSAEAVEAGAAAHGLPPGLHTLACPQGAIDLILYFYTSRNQQLAEAMVEWRRTEVNQITTTPSDTLPPKFQSAEYVDNFLYRALKYRLEKLIPVLDVWPQALGILALPSHIPSSMALQAQLVDEVWAQAGDRSTDMTWYAKRLGLAYVYNLSELYMLQDKSPELMDSWNFLHDRIADLRSLKQMDLKAVSSMLRSGVFALGSVTCNILGLTKNR